MTESTVEPPTSISISPLENTPIRVLHVDDDTGFLRVAKQILEMQGHVEVSTASSVTEALKKLGDGSYDAVVSDYQMPVRDGLEFLKELRENGNNIPFIIFTGKGREEVAIKALNLGADQYLNKIGDPQTVYGELEHAIRKTVKSKRGEETQELIQKRLENVFAASPDAITVTDLKGNIIECNNATLELMGFSSKEEVIGKNAFEFIVEDDRDRAIENLKKTLEQNTIKNVEYKSLTKQGNCFIMELSVSVVRDSSGKPKGFVGITKDISLRKKAEEALRESDEKWRFLFANMLEGFAYCKMIYDEKKRPVDFEYLEINDAFEKLTGLKREDVVGKRVTEAIPGIRKAHPELIDIYGEVASTGKKDQIELHFKPLDIWLSISVYSPKKSYFVAVFENITGRKKTEEDLRQSEMKYRNIFELAPDGIITVDLKGVVTSVNPTFSKLTGYSKEEVIGKHFTRLGTVQARNMPRYLKLMRSALSGKLPSKFEYSYTRKNGDTGWAEGHFGILRREGKIIGFQGILRELTEHKKALNALDNSEQRYRTLMEETPVGIVNLDIKGKITFVNKRLEEITGYSRKEFLGKNWIFLVREHAVVSDNNLKFAVKRVKDRLLGRAAPPLRLPLKRKDGRWIWTEAESKVIKRSGVPIGLQASLRDITELVEADKSLKKSLQKLKVLNEKLEVVGSLTRHDLRNKLSTMLGRIYLAKEKLSENHDALTDLDEVQSSISEAERILDFARIYEIIGIEELTYVNVSNNIKEAISLLPEGEPKLQGIKISDETQGFTVLADSLLRQLFYNLIHNSMTHGEHVDQVSIRYSEGKDSLKLIYEDDGVGIPDGEKEKIFKEGYGKGTGYGLYLIKKMCEVYGWTIEETGKEGKGAQFTMSIPKLNEQGIQNYKLD